MKYFKLQDTPELKYAPQIKNWYGKFDVRDIRLETYYKLPKRQLFIIEPHENNIFTDIILYPFLLVSPKVMHVIKMYGELCFSCEIILFDQLKKKSELYYLPVFNETRKLQIVKKNSDSKPFLKKVDVNKDIFWVRDSMKKHTIISLNLAESLLQREVFGLGIEEIELFMEKETG